VKLHPDWKVAHKLWSVQLSVLAAILNGVWMATPVLQGYVPPLHFFIINIGLSLAVVACRLIDQDIHVDDN